MTHTPGPWELDGELPFIKANGLLVAAVVRDDNGRWLHGDAHLIAAAPDLLEALELVDAYSKHDQLVGPELKKRVRAVIAKARGE